MSRSAATLLYWCQWSQVWTELWSEHWAEASLYSVQQQCMVRCGAYLQKEPSELGINVHLGHGTVFPRVPLLVSSKEHLVAWGEGPAEHHLNTVHLHPFFFTSRSFECGHRSFQSLLWHKQQFCCSCHSGTLLRSNIIRVCILPLQTQVLLMSNYLFGCWIIWKQMFWKCCLYPKMDVGEPAWPHQCGPGANGIGP